MNEKTEEILSKLNKKTRERLMLAKEHELKKLPLASIGLTAALGGGFGFGRQNLIWGKKSAGKSAMLLQTVAMAQKDGLSCAWVDAEAAFDKEWASRLGVDVENLILSPIKSTEEMVEVSSDLLKAGIDVLVVDSITALLPLSWYEKGGGELKGLSGTRQIGSQSVDMAAAVKLLNGVNKTTCLILIAQTRKKIETWGAVDRPTGGQAVEFYSSSTVRLTASASDKEQIKMPTMKNGKMVEGNVGRPVTWLIEYNKVGEPSQSGGYDFYYRGEQVGVDRLAESVDLAVNMDIIQKGGAWYNYEEVKFQGRDKIIDYFKGNPDDFDELLKRINNG